MVLIINTFYFFKNNHSSYFLCFTLLSITVVSVNCLNFIKTTTYLSGGAYAEGFLCYFCNMNRDKNPRGGGKSKRIGENRMGGKGQKPNSRFQKKTVRPKTQKRDDSIRLNKYIANAGICSRREADMHISIGSVSVNGKVITAMGYKVKPGDQVRFDGRLIKPERPEYILLNKPKGFLSTTKDEKARKTVMDLIANATNARVVPVGRLDRPTTGLLLFTNDGDLAKHLMHPSSNIRKIYHVVLDKKLSQTHFNEIKNGVELEDGMMEVDEISWIPSATKREVGVRIHSGKNRIVRRLFEHFEYNVERLDRVVFAGLTKKDLPRGHWRHLTQQEVINLKML